MGYAIELYFDQNSEDKIRKIWKALYEKNISTFMYESNSIPHITLSVYNDNLNDMNEFVNHVISYSKQLTPFKLVLSNIGVFNTKEGVVFLGPKVTSKLLNVHKDFHEHMKKYEKHEWKYYSPDLWIPHCTMAIDIDKPKMLDSVDIISSMFEPIELNIERVGIIKFRPIEYIEIIKLLD